MKKVKSLVFAFIFLITQVSYANSISPAKKGFYIPLSKMILTNEELAQLSDDDKVIYFRALVYLVQVLEVSQAKTVDYEDSDADTSAFNSNSVKKTHASLVSYYWDMMVSKSQAMIGGMIQGAWKMTAWGAKAVVVKSAESVGKAKGVIEKGLSRADEIVVKGHAEKLRVAEEAVKANKKAVSSFQSGIPSNAPMTAQQTARLAKLNKSVAASEKKLTGVKNSIVDAGHTVTQIRSVIPSLATNKNVLGKDFRALLKDVAQADKDYDRIRKIGTAAQKRSALAKVKRLRGSANDMEMRFRAAGATSKEISAIYRAANTSSARWLLNNSAEIALLAGAAGYAGYKGAEALGWIGGGASAGVIDPSRPRVSGSSDQNLGTIKQDDGYTCIYGGRPSTLRTKSAASDTDKKFYCKKPEEGENENCKGIRFQCNSYGFESSGDIQGDMCVPRYPLSALTRRCMDALAMVIDEEEKNVLHMRDPGQLGRFSDKVRKMLEAVDGNIMASDVEPGKTHSFSYYCEKSNNAQPGECEAIAAFVDKIRSRPGIEKILDERRLAQVDSSGSSSGARPAASPPVSSGATDGSPKQ
ncbi:MAG: hypothetical protein JNL11_16230 [Bdellovibrionaceae bacterium]|nr:hypothetical protein [Pseudobdellovibrionaceae bacterium]